MSESWQEFAKRQSDYAVKLERELATAERERDEARRERDAYKILSANNADVADTLRQRAERAERVVEAAKAWEDAYRRGDLLPEYADALQRLHRAVRALDAEAQP